MRLDGDRLRRARLSRGLSQGELAQAAGVGLHTVWRAENGALSGMRPGTARKIAAALDVELDTLIDWDASGDPPKAAAA